jgi:hypothetical protein
MGTGKTTDPPAASRGQRIGLVSVETVPGHPPCNLALGEEGPVTLADSLGTVHVAWDRGGEYGLIPGHDCWSVIGNQ